MIEHVLLEYKYKVKEDIFRGYVGDILKCVAERWGAKILYRYTDLIEPHKEEPENGDEVALEVIEKLGLKVKTHGFYETESDTVA